MSHYDGVDPLSVLRADDLPVQPDPAFAARLRTRLEGALSAPTNTGRGPKSVTGPRYPFRAGRAVPRAAGARTVKLRTAVGVALVSMSLLGVGLVWSFSRDGFSGSTGDRSASALRQREASTFATSELDNAASVPAFKGGLADLAGSEVPPRQAPPPPRTPVDGIDKRDVVTTGSLRMVVAEPTAVGDRIVSLVADAGGRVDSRSERSRSSSQSESPTVDLVLRIPSDKLDGVLADANKLGAVESMSIGHSDVTSQRVDLDARIEALQTSVNRLLQLMGRAGNVADLLAAESALTQRQADLDSLRAQRTTLGDEISYATINVNLSAEPPVTRNGFLGALGHGWQALLWAVHGVVAAAGFLIPWIPVLAVLAVGIGFVVRRRRKARQP